MTHGMPRAKELRTANGKELLDELIPTILKTTLHRYALDTHASEHGARMTAMDKATENAQEMLTELKISYNKARQEAITKELSEIVDLTKNEQEQLSDNSDQIVLNKLKDLEILF